MATTRNLARMAGVLYLAVGVLGGFAEYVRTSAVTPGDAQATAAGIVQHSTLFHLGLAADLIDLPCFIAVGLILYRILKPVEPTVALAMLVLNAVSVAMQGVNMLNQAGALIVATHPEYATGMTSLFFLELHREGYVIAQIFFGGYMLPLAYLVYRSAMFPKALGIVLAVGGAGYLAGVVATVASANLNSGVAAYFGLIGGLGEIVFLLWLLVFGAGAATTDRTQATGALTWKA